ncbi:MAG TPA: hypothetical protein DCG38_06830 [Eubacteriaceae bacterium]|nr:hypothetical protein [Eubacteriaceae bacterium]
MARITVCTKWQSSLVFGNRTKKGQGKPLIWRRVSLFLGKPAGPKTQSLLVVPPPYYINSIWRKS